MGNHVKQTYKKGIDLTEEEVNKILAEGYSIHTIHSYSYTTLHSEYTEIHYHFVKEEIPYVSPVDWNMLNINDDEILEGDTGPDCFTEEDKQK